MVLDVHRKGSRGVGLSVAEAIARVSQQAGKAAALAIGIDFLSFVGEGGYPIRCIHLKTKGLQNVQFVSA